MSQMPPSAPGTYMKPHRGAVVLVLGILGLVMCVILGIIAWVMGNADLKEMDAGTMDPSGRGLTNAGKICGMISVILTAVALAFYVLMFVIIGAAGVAGAASNGSP